MKKYYADIDLYFDDMSYGIVGDSNTTRIEMINLVKDFAKEMNLECNTKSKKLFNKEGKEVGSFTINSRTI
jgi:hypothetical protein